MHHRVGVREPSVAETDPAREFACSGLIDAFFGVAHDQFTHFGDYGARDQREEAADDTERQEHEPGDCAAQEKHELFYRHSGHPLNIGWPNHSPSAYP